MSNLPIGSRIESQLKHEAEQGVPDGINLWPQIREKGLAMGPVSGIAEASGRVMPNMRQSLAARTGKISIAKIVTAGAMLLLLLAVLPFIGRNTTAVSAAALLQKATNASTFVPAGKVRHIIVRVTDDVSGEGGGMSSEAWIGNGKEHLLLWKPAPTSAMGQAVQGSFSELINNDGMYQFHPDTNTVYKVPYNPNYYALRDVLPDKAAIDAMLASPKTRVAGTDVIDGRSVVVIEGHVGSFVAGSPIDIAEGRAKGYDTAQHDYKLWIDSHTYQVVQEQHYITWEGTGPTGHHQETSTKRITVDELLDSGAVSANLFKLPAGMQVADTANRPTPLPMELHTDWYTFSPPPPDNSFSLLMPRTPEQGSTTNGAANNTVTMYGVKQGGLAYVIKYTTYPQEDIQKVGVEKWLDNERDYIVLGVPGKLLSEKPLSLEGYPGRELRVEANDGKFRICRIYLANNHFYNVYVVMPDEKSVTPEIQRYLDSFRLLKP